MLIMGFELFIAFRYLTARRKGVFVFFTTLISIAGVALGVAALIVTLSVMNGFKEDIQEKILGTQSHLVVLSSAQKALEESHEITKNILLTEGVIHVAPFILSQGIIRHGKKSTGCVVKGIKPDEEKKITSIGKYIVKGSLDDVKDEGEIPVAQDSTRFPGIIVGKELARNIGVTVDSQVVIISPESLTTPFGNFPRSKIYRIAGIFHSGMYEFDANLVYMHLTSAQELFNLESLINGYGVRIVDLYDAERIAGDIRERLGVAYWIRSWIEMNRNLFSALKLEKTVMFIVLTLIVLVAAFNIISNLFLLTMEKSRDIGILRAIGSKTKSILNIFIIEGLSSGILGIVFGGCLGIGISVLLDRYRFIHLPADVYYIDTLPVKLFWGDILLVCSAALLISLLATVIPAIKASRINPVEAIRYG